MLKREEINFLSKNGYLKFPKILQIEVTNRCPLQCPQCYKNIENQNDIDFSLLEKVLREGALNGLKIILINGGEPLMYPRFFDLLDLLAELDISAICYISGYGVNEEIAKKISKYRISIYISLNGSTEAINSLSRDGYEYSINAIEIFSKMNIPYGINWVARDDNLDDFENMLRLAENFSANSLIVLGNKMTHNQVVESALSRDRLQILISKIKTQELSNSHLIIEKQRCFTELCTLYYNPKNTVNTGCPAGIVFCFMDLKGNFYPCSHLNYPETYEKVSEYWHNSKILYNLRNCKSNDNDPCVSCRYKTGCKFCKAESILTHNAFNVGNRYCNIFSRK